jgi:hypothetical protein
VTVYSSHISRNLGRFLAAIHLCMH